METNTILDVVNSVNTGDVVHILLSNIRVKGIVESVDSEVLPIVEVDPYDNNKSVRLCIDVSKIVALGTEIITEETNL